LSLIWLAYSSFLYGEYCIVGKNIKEYHENIGKTIRIVEGGLKFVSQDKENKAYLLYFLGYLYSKVEDYITVKQRLEECMKLKPTGSFREDARELLGNIWNRKLGITCWDWWLKTPKGLKRGWKKLSFVFIVLLLSYIGIIALLHPWGGRINYGIFPENIQWGVYLYTSIFLFFLLFLPNLRHFKIGNFEIDLKEPPDMNLKILPSKLEEHLLSWNTNIPRAEGVTGSGLL